MLRSSPLYYCAEALKPHPAQLIHLAAMDLDIYSTPPLPILAHSDINPDSGVPRMSCGQTESSHDQTLIMRRIALTQDPLLHKLERTTVRFHPYARAPSLPPIPIHDSRDSSRAPSATPAPLSDMVSVRPRAPAPNPPTTTGAIPLTRQKKIPKCRQPTRCPETELMACFPTDKETQTEIKVCKPLS